jgi:hypothetical protein
MVLLKNETFMTAKTRLKCIVRFLHIRWRAAIFLFEKREKMSEMKSDVNRFGIP